MPQVVDGVHAIESDDETAVVRSMDIELRKLSLLNSGTARPQNHTSLPNVASPKFSKKERQRESAK